MQVIEYGTIRTEAATPMHIRLLELFAGLTDAIARLEPQAVAVEELYMSRNVSTAITVGQARGVALLAAAAAGLSVHEYAPNAVKLALTGYGAADKRQVQSMLKLVLGLETVPRPDDAADAIAIALCHLQTIRPDRSVRPV